MTTFRAPLIVAGLAVLALVAAPSPRAPGRPNRRPLCPHHRLRRLRPRDRAHHPPSPGPSAAQAGPSSTAPEARGPRRPTASTPSPRWARASSSRPPATGPVTTRWVAADGSPGRREWRTGYGLAVSARGKAVAFAGRRGRVWAIDSAGDRVLAFNPGADHRHGRAVAVIGEDCKESGPATGARSTSTEPAAWYTSSHGIVERSPHLQSGLDRPGALGSAGSRRSATPAPAAR